MSPKNLSQANQKVHAEPVLSFDDLLCYLITVAAIAEAQGGTDNIQLVKDAGKALLKPVLKHEIF